MNDKNVVLKKAGKGKWTTRVKDWKMQDFCNRRKFENGKC